MKYSEFDSVTENVANPTLKAIFKYKDHPSILAYRAIAKKNYFSEVNSEDIKKDILKLDKTKSKL